MITVKTIDRQGNYDLLRIISTIAVIAIHVNYKYLKGYLNSLVQVDSTIWIFENVINFISRFSVPCFVMLSGTFALRSPKTMDAKNYYKKIIYKQGIPFVAVYIMWMFIYCLRAIATGNWLSFFTKIVTFDVGNLWFMPMIFGLYLIAPVIVRLKSDKEISNAAISAFCVWSIVSQATSNYELPFSIGVVISFLSYFLIGYIFDTKPIKINIVVCIAGMFFVTVIASWWRCTNHQFYAIDPYKSFFSPCVMMLSILVFIVFKQINIKNCKILTFISERTFYIYLVHTPILIIVITILNKTRINEIVKIFCGTMATFLISFIVSTIGTFLGKCIEIKLHNN